MCCMAAGAGSTQIRPRCLMGNVDLDLCFFIALLLGRAERGQEEALSSHGRLHQCHCLAMPAGPCGWGLSETWLGIGPLPDFSK